MHALVDEFFGIAKSTSVVISQWFIVALIKVTLPLHLTRQHEKVYLR